MKKIIISFIIVISILLSLTGCTKQFDLGLSTSKQISIGYSNQSYIMQISDEGTIKVIADLFTSIKNYTQTNDDSYDGSSFRIQFSDNNKIITFQVDKTDTVKLITDKKYYKAKLDLIYDKILIVYKGDTTNSNSQTTTSCTGTVVAKEPIIYLYPTKTTDVSVALNFSGKLTCTYPPYNNIWNVTAQPDGTLSDRHSQYSYLFWEGEGQFNFDTTSGFVVKGEDTAKFLQEKLSYMGLSPKECSDFIVFWLPQMQENPYNFISFQNDFYQKYAPMNITPRPDSEVYVYMVFKALKEQVKTTPQVLKPQTRTGFSVVEWGGSEIK